MVKFSFIPLFAILVFALSYAQAQTCSTNEEKKANQCPENTCDQPTLSGSSGTNCSAAVKIKALVCRCKAGFVRDPFNKKCVKLALCTKHCNAQQIQSCSADCWSSNRTLGVCDYSCSCNNCTSSAQCDPWCTTSKFLGGVCTSAGTCGCSNNCNVGRSDAGFCKSCCKDSCIAKGFLGGTCNRKNNCTCTKHTDDTCDDFCYRKGLNTVLCDNGKCICGGCNDDLCTKSCNEATVTVDYCPPTCYYGLITSQCFCWLDLTLEPSGSPQCADWIRLDGNVPSRNKFDVCGYKTKCDEDVCTEVCIKEGRGNGTCQIDPNNPKFGAMCVCEQEPGFYPRCEL